MQEKTSDRMRELFGPPRISGPRKQTGQLEDFFRAEATVPIAKIACSVSARKQLIAYGLLLEVMRTICPLWEAHRSAVTMTTLTILHDMNI
jgi:hypothetical protein